MLFFPWMCICHFITQEQTYSFHFIVIWRGAYLTLNDYIFPSEFPLALLHLWLSIIKSKFPKKN